MTTQNNPAEKKQVLENAGIKLIDYSAKAFAVIGNTIAIKEKLKNIGGRFNRNLNINNQKEAGWIFSKRKESDLRELINNTTMSVSVDFDNVLIEHIKKQDVFNENSQSDNQEQDPLF